MLMIIGSVLVTLGVVIIYLVDIICNECNKHQLWKGDVENYLDLLDRAGIAVIIVAIMCFVLGYIG